MFSFFKFIQKTIKDLKGKKGLWFTILSVLSLSGIFLSLYILTHMTENSSKEVYTSISSTYNKAYRNKFLEKEEVFKQMMIGIKGNSQLLQNIENNNLVDVRTSVDAYNQRYKEAGFNTLTLSFYPLINQVNQYRNSVNSVINSKAKIYGLEVLLDGVFMVYLEPILKDENIIGVFELRKEIADLKTEFFKDDIIFTFLLEERMLNKLSIKARNGKYREVIEQMNVEELKYDGQFVGKIADGGKDSYNQMLELGYSVDDVYFRAAQEISDINGNIIGVVILGELVDGSGAFVNIVDKMTKTVTTVALGLVISILLFMF